MNSSDTLWALRRQISMQTAEKFVELIAVFDDALSLLIDTNAILEGLYKITDHHTSEGASQSAAWRFLSTLPTSIDWCYFAALNGDYGISKNLLRLTLEEAVKLAYYVTFPDKALRQILRGGDNDETNIGNMLKALDSERRSGLMRLHGELSAFYSHANLNLPPELIFKESDGRTVIGGGPRFAPDLFEPIVHQLLILAVNVLRDISIGFPRLTEDSNWLAKFEKIIPAMAAAIPD